MEPCSVNILSSGHVYNRSSLPPFRPKVSLLPHIPEEIVLEILTHLPIRSLLRFKCVCKHWQHRISNSKFSFSMQRHRSMIMCKGMYRLPFNLYVIDNEKEAFLREVPRPRQNKNKEMSLDWFQILGSCNGLLLVSYSRKLYLWNPLTRQCTKLLISLSWWDSYSGCTGFCYDSTTDEYKVVMGLGSVAMVASIRSKSWVTIPYPYKEKIIYSGPVVNERLYWRVDYIDNNGMSTEDHDKSKIHQIVYFDPVTDKFVEVPAPRPTIEEWNVVMGLGVVDGSLCVVRNCENRYAEVFIVKESWTRMFIINNLTGLCGAFKYELVPLCFTKNGEVVVAVNGKTIFVYNTIEKSQREIHSADNYGEINVISYMESLVSTSEYGHEEDRIEEGPKGATMNLLYRRTNTLIESQSTPTTTTTTTGMRKIPWTFGRVRFLG
ncbi:F-box/kelch-repeat protein [Actinidia chinensis var. chinensis]|uniref:F-box/kelch-repeat protein n=1 Tax=Actinidia chinensis var. chinensis TaxID=1590841 RepID=A0A2R6PKA0_ACTCC|nr:F-box/kelch-repeat protein [Actinidia chinensis var. chinensis]